MSLPDKFGRCFEHGTTLHDKKQPAPAANPLSPLDNPPPRRASMHGHLSVGFMKRGFTLVELSIVLVIIGLLIGGILVAQSMTETARIVAVAAQIQQFDAGVESFKAKYNALPGDAQQFGGNGDGLVTITSTGGLM